jgi:hypothetical protein
VVEQHCANNCGHLAILGRKSHVRLPIIGSAEEKPYTFASTFGGVQLCKHFAFACFDALDLLQTQRFLISGVQTTAAGSLPGQRIRPIQVPGGGNPNGLTCGGFFPWIGVDAKIKSVAYDQSFCQLGGDWRLSKFSHHRKWEGES